LNELRDRFRKVENDVALLSQQVLYEILVILLCDHAIMADISSTKNIFAFPLGMECGQKCDLYEKIKITVGNFEVETKTHRFQSFEGLKS
jgi:uncharacterized protein YebE (UPF0316 family)